MEAAFVFPVLFLVLMATVDFSRLFYTSVVVSNAAAAGVRQGVYDSSHAPAAMQIAASADASMPVNPSASLFCTCSNSPSTEISCTSSCGTSAPRKYVQVTTQATYKTLVSWPMIPSSVRVNGKSCMRIQ